MLSYTPTMLIGSLSKINANASVWCSGCEPASRCWILPANISISWVFINNRNVGAAWNSEYRLWSVQGASLVTIWTGMFGSREAGLGRVSSFNRWASVKEGIRRASNPWFEADWIFIDTSVVKERGNFLINGFPRVARPDLYFEEYWSMELCFWLQSFGERKTEKGYSPIVWSWIFLVYSVFECW